MLRSYGVRVRMLAAAGLVCLGVAPARATQAQPSSTQQVVVTAPSYASTTGTLTAYQFSGGVWHVVVGPVRAELGYRGLSDNRSEGDGTTPTGTYGFGPTMYGVADAAPNARYAYHKLVCGDWWSGVRDDTYNTFQHIDCGQDMDNSEALWQQTTAYQHFAVIDFNTNPTVIGKGSAIFLHDATSSGVTSGCVAVAPSALDAVLGWLDPAQHPVIRIGTRAQVGPPAPLAVPPTPPPVPTRVAAPRPRLTTPRPTAPPTSRPAPSTSTTTTTAATVPPTTETAATTSTPIEFAAPVAVVLQPEAGDSGRAKAFGTAAAGLLIVNVSGLGALALRRRTASTGAA